MYHRENPPSMSIHEEATYSVNVSSMPICSEPRRSSISTRRRTPSTRIMPELATSWSWSADKQSADLQAARRREVARRQAVHRRGREVHLRHADGQVAEQLPQESAQGLVLQRRGRDRQRRLQATFHLKRPQPAILAMLASGYTPIYPCHVPAAQMRTNPIGTGPFKFVELKQNESIKLDEEPGLLEEGPALSRRHRVHDHPEPLDRDPRLRRRQVRHDVPDRGHRSR